MLIRPEKFGAFLRKRRKSLTYTYADITEKAGITEHTMRRFEQGVFPRGDLLEPLCQVLKIKVHFHVMLGEGCSFKEFEADDVPEESATDYVLNAVYQHTLEDDDDDAEAADGPEPLFAVIDPNEDSNDDDK